jgi:L-2-hydroxyglutarate oxidase LhgO
MPMNYDLVIIGAGVVGLACSSLFSEKGLNTLVLEKNHSFGEETSSRNSEVIHAGMYYPNNSLKAQLCVGGNKLIYEWCSKKNVPFRRLGKFIIAISNDEIPQLENIYRRGKENGVENLQPCTIGYLKKSNPGVKAVAALWSPDTGIIDSHKLMESFYENAAIHDCDFAFNHKVIGIEKITDGYKISIQSGDDIFEIDTNKIINAAGLYSDTIAEFAGIDIEKNRYKLHFCKGHYFRIHSSKNYLAANLIYPVPQENFAGLGVHVTLDLAGELKLGPDTFYMDEKNQDYSVPENLNLKFFESASRYLNNLELDDISADQSGIRPKLQGKGEPFRDFIICEESDKGLPGFVNLIGIESPGLTASLAIAKVVWKLLE